MQAGTQDLQAALAHQRQAPKNYAPIDLLCWRPGTGVRTFVEDLHLDKDSGIPGDRWTTTPWMRLPDGRPDPRIQVSILPIRVMQAVWLDRDGQPHPGDPITADLDCSYSNLPVGSHIQAGSAVLEVSDVFNDACVKWKQRYGAAAKDWITARENVHLRLRGLLCSIVQSGTVTRNDKLIKL